ncbi:MAG TPA: histone H1 [Planctomycetota bacterium]|nr:histone H1 [Planctomycetota bacterium]
MGVEKYDELSRLVGEARAQFAEFQTGKKVAAMRARKLLQQIKKLAQECRIEVQELKKPKGDAPPAPPLVS